MRKFIFNSGIISAVFSGYRAIRATSEQPRDWRTVLWWVSWGATLAIAIGTVVIEAREELEEWSDD